MIPPEITQLLIGAAIAIAIAVLVADLASF
jgi:hypothetical protein